MPYEAQRDLYSSFSGSLSSVARRWYLLENAMIGAQELPVYARALRVRNVTGAPLVLVVVPLGEESDAATQVITVDTTELLPFSVRRIVSLNGAATIPAGTGIQVITA